MQKLHVGCDTLANYAPNSSCRLQPVRWCTNCRYESLATLHEHDPLQEWSVSFLKAKLQHLQHQATKHGHERCILAVCHDYAQQASTVMHGCEFLHDGDVQRQLNLAVKRVLQTIGSIPDRQRIRKISVQHFTVCATNSST